MIYYARSVLPKSIFLAGPTPRSRDVKSWRPEALEYLKEFPGDVYVPEDSAMSPKFDYDDQVEWEWEGIETATVVLFWIPREMINMPAFTTNVEFGMSLTRNMVVGWPEDAAKNKYLGRLAQRSGRRVHETLSLTCAAAWELALSPYAKQV